MTPLSLIDEVILEFGQFSGRKTQLFELFKNVLWEIESIMRPTETLEAVVKTPVLTPDNLLHISLSVENPFEVGRVINTQNGRDVVRLSLRALNDLKRWDFVPVGSFYVFDQETKDLFLNAGAPPVPVFDFEISYFVHTQVPSMTTDLPILDRLYPVLRVGLLAKVSRILKDMERAGIYEKEYLDLIGASK